MADQEQELERVSSELEDLRGNMGQVMEILQVIKAKLDTQTTVVSEINGPTIEPQPARTVPTTWPVYGLPPGFTPPTEGAPGFFEDQQHAPDFSDEDDERHEDIRGMKENFQILEKRLRAMEGDQVFGAAAKEMCLVSVQYVQQPYVAAVTPNFNQSQAPVYQPIQQAPVYQQAPMPPAYQQSREQAPRPQNLPNQNRVQRGRLSFSSIPMTYTELYPSLLQKRLVTPRPLGPPPNPLPPWYNQDAHCLFHEGAPGHDLEGCYALKHIVRELVKKKILSFRDVGPNVKTVRFQTDISTEAAKKPEGNEAFLAYQAGRQGAFGSNNVQPPNAMQLPQQSRKSTDSAQLHGSNQDAQLRGQNSEQQQMLNPSIPCGSKQVSERKHTGKKKQKVLENPSTSSSRFQCSPNDTMVLLKLVSFTRKPPHLHLLRLHSGFEWQCQHHKGEYLQKRIDQSHCVIFFLRFDGRQQQEVGMKKNM
ncbi:white-opaque regulator 2 [Lathyrus oleraceus]|uniref:white-opaque regulator 2 n=1 Tax=Pisum sativum TaxID=3888 RepID=UPI0021CE2ACB|nr:white-opaque regulator 2-like [Pisum sativum]